jgi:hypothetical protein
MKSVVRSELPTAAAGSSPAPTAAVDNSAPRSTHPEPTYKSGKTVQITGTTSFFTIFSGYQPPPPNLQHIRSEPSAWRLGTVSCV